METAGPSKDMRELACHSWHRSIECRFRQVGRESLRPLAGPKATLAYFAGVPKRGRATARNESEQPVTGPHDSQPQPAGTEFVVCEAAAPADDARLQVRLERDILWLTQRQMAGLVRTSASNVSWHLAVVFAEGELAAPEA